MWAIQQMARHAMVFKQSSLINVIRAHCKCVIVPTITSVHDIFYYYIHLLQHRYLFLCWFFFVFSFVFFWFVPSSNLCATEEIYMPVKSLAEKRLLKILSCFCVRVCVLSFQCMSLLRLVSFILFQSSFHHKMCFLIHFCLDPNAVQSLKFVATNRLLTLIHMQFDFISSSSSSSSEFIRA